MNPRTAPQPPTDAFHFAAEAVVEAGAKNGAAGKFKGTAYSGEAIHRHWFWGTVIFDLETTQAADRIPALVQHDPGQRAGFATLEITDRITAEGTLLDNTHGAAIAAESKAGFPWQMSIRIDPASIEEISAGATVTVNGHAVTGPATVFRNNLIREVSFTPVGADPHTEAHAMAHRHHPDPTQHPPEPDMDLKAAQERIQALEAENTALTAAAKTAAEEAQAAKDALTAFHKTQRDAAVKELFSALGRDHTPEAAAPYLAMDDTTFSAVAADLKRHAAKPTPPEDGALFADTAATPGDDGATAPTEQARERNADSIAKYL